MTAKTIFLTILFCCLVSVIAIPARAGEPTEKIKETTDKIISIVTDPELKDPARAEERKRLIRSAVDERFDWEEMSRRALAREWLKRSEEERQEFVALFGALLERTYLDKVEGYSGEKVHYEGEAVDGKYGVVLVKFVTSQDLEVPVRYRLKKKEDDWAVYDISIEGVSLVNNYRVQFKNIIAKSSYEKLVVRLRAKVEEQ